MAEVEPRPERTPPIARPARQIQTPMIQRRPVAGRCGESAASSAMGDVIAASLNDVRTRASALLGLLLLPLLIAAPTALHASEFESQVLAELNRIRAHPQAYARELRRQQVAQTRYGDDAYDGGGGGMSQEDPDAVEDAIDFLMRQRPLPPLADDGRLAAAARAHVARQGPTGDVGHGAPGALGQRLQRAGLFAGLEAETISYGQRTPDEVIRQLVVDSRVPSRGHRLDLFGHGYQAAGVACGRHAEWGSMCVIDLAGAIVRR